MHQDLSRCCHAEQVGTGRRRRGRGQEEEKEKEGLTPSFFRGVGIPPTYGHVPSIHWFKHLTALSDSMAAEDPWVCLKMDGM